MRWILVMLLLVALPFAGSALTVSSSFSNTTADDDNSTLEDASSSSSLIGAASQTLATVGSSTASIGRKFIGQAAAGDGGSIIQSINVSVTWTVTAEAWETYSIAITPEFYAWMYIEDGGLFAESGDGVWFSTLSAILKVNGSSVNDSLDITGGSKEDRGDGVTLDRTRSQTLSGYSGNNTFELIYSGTLTVTSKAGSAGNDTYVAGLWGQDGTLSIGSDGLFDNYSSSGDRDADGLFVDAVVTLSAVPEPASILMIALGGGLIALKRRFFSKL